MTDQTCFTLLSQTPCQLQALFKLHAWGAAKVQPKEVEVVCVCVCVGEGEIIYQEEGRLSGELERERLRYREEELREPEWERERERDPLLVQQDGLLGDKRREEGGETEPREGEQLDGGELEGEQGVQSKSRSRGVPSHG